jgi:hypothetical protein
VPTRTGDADLLRESIRHASPSQIAALRHDPRSWVRRIAAAEVTRRACEAADEVVCREPLRLLVRRFCEEWRTERPPVAGQFGQGKHRERRQVAFVGPVEWLSAESGIARGSIENITRPKARSEVVPYDVADALVVALGRPDAMYDGTLVTTTRSAASCCPGSETSR